jgi:hypothetical protein
MKQRHLKRRGRETPLFPQPGPVNTGALACRPVQLVGGSVEGQRPAHLMTAHQEE